MRAAAKWGSVLLLTTFSARLAAAEASSISTPGTNREALERDAVIIEALHAAQKRRQQLRASPPSVGAVTLDVDGEPVGLTEPIAHDEGQFWIPLRPVAAALYVSVVELGEGAFELISRDGQTRTVTVHLLNQRPVMTPEELIRVFGVHVHTDAVRQHVSIITPHPPAFQTAVMEKPPEQLEEEAAEHALIQQAKEPAEVPAYLPEEAQPDVKLRGSVASTYVKRHLAGPLRSLSSALEGRWHGFDLRFQDSRKDINGVFDHDYTYLNLTKPDLFIGLFDQQVDLAPLRAQSQPIEGMKLRRVLGRGSPYNLTLASGRTQTSVSGTSGSTKYLGTASQMMHEWVPASWLRLKGALTYLENEADLPERAGTSTLPRHNLVSFAGAEWLLPAELTLATHLAHADYRSDNAFDGDSLTGDWDWRTGLAWDKERSRLGAYYEFVGDRYASLGDPGLYRDYQGWTVTGIHEMSPRWFLASNLLLYRNNVSDKPQRVTTRNQAVTLSSRHQLTDQQSLSLSLNNFLTDPSGPDPGSSLQSQIYRADYFLPFVIPRSRLLASYQYFRSEATTASDSSSHTIGPALFGSYGRGSSWYLSPQVIRTSRETNDDELQFTTTLNLNHYLLRDLSVFWNSSYSWDQLTGSRPVETASWSCGLQHKPLRDTAMRVEYSVNSYNLKTERGRWPRDWSIIWYLSQAFGMSTAPKLGTIDGWVFQDLNADRLHNDGEPWVEEARLSLEDDREALTDAQGHLTFARLVPGGHLVSLDPASLSPEWLVKEPTRAVHVKGRRATKVFFPLLRAASASGRVFLDENQDGRFQEDAEEPLEGVAVVLSPGDQFRRTGPDGSFQFATLLPGVYTLHVHRADLPPGYELRVDEPVIMELAGGTAEDVDFAVRLVSAGPVRRF